METSIERTSFTNVSNKIPLSIEQMQDHMTTITDGWPKVIAGDLCYRDGDDVYSLPSSTALFAWIDKYASVSWQRGAVSKEEFFEGLRQRAERFTWSSPYPHFPPIPGVYYTCKVPKAKNTGALDELINRFQPSTALDRQLLKALGLTLFWGGPSGKRPSFILTSEPGPDRLRGCGVGKTSLGELFSKLVGGYISVRLHTSQDRVISGFLSPTSWPKRIALIDNLKTYRFSNDMIESLVTCEEINGHRLHHGFAVRPNLLTWIVTVNGASFSKDMAQRSVVIWLKRPKVSGSWYTDTASFIEENRERIVADVRWHLEQPAEDLQKLDRWADWGQGVLSRLEHPRKLLRELKLRRGSIDEDDQDTDDLIEHIRTCLCAALPGKKPDRIVVRIPSLKLAKWVRQLKTGMRDRQAAQYLRQVQSPRLRYQHKSDGRYYIWTGESAPRDMQPEVLKYTASDAGSPRNWAEEDDD